MRCSACAGMWLPYSYIDSLRHDRSFDTGVFRQQLQDGAKSAGHKRCPAGCGQLSVSRLHDTQLDWCPACQGVWFDSGELRQVLEKHPRIGSGAVSAVDGFVAFEVVAQVLAAIASIAR